MTILAVAAPTVAGSNPGSNGSRSPAQEAAAGGGADLVRSYLRDIGRVPLLTHEQEITLGRQVQELVAIEELEQELTMRAGGTAPSQEELA
ncbi:MAG: sigma-70 factor domain-containing protein, partial [Cyanobium sp.]